MEREQLRVSSSVDPCVVFAGVAQAAPFEDSDIPEMFFPRQDRLRQDSPIDLAGREPVGIQPRPAIPFIGKWSFREGVRVTIGSPLPIATGVFSCSHPHGRGLCVF